MIRHIYFEKPDEGKDGFEYIVEKQNQKILCSS